MSNNTEKPSVVQIDMTPDGRFAPSAGSDAAPWAFRLLRFAIVAGVLTIVAALLALTLWVALALIPIILAIGVISYIAVRIQMWRRGVSGSFPVRNPWG